MNYILILFMVTILTCNYACGEPVENNCCERPPIRNETLRIYVALQQAGIVPDEISTSPGTLLGVEWGNAKADLGNCIPRVETLNPPYYTYDDADSDAYYTLIIIDSDTLSRAAQIEGYYLHNLCVNIAGSRFFSQISGFSVAPYIPTAPCAVSQRILVLLCRQESVIETNDLDLLKLGVNRVGFDLEAFFADYPIGELVAINYWITSNNCCNTNYNCNGNCNCNGNSNCNANSICNGNSNCNGNCYCNGNN